MTNQELKDAALEAVKISHDWMLKDILHRAEQTKGDDYTPELQHAISTQKLLEKLA